MSNSEANIENMLFVYETTYQNDFRHGEIKAPVLTVFHEKKKSGRKESLPVKDIHTMTNWKNDVPFHLLHKPRDIIDTNPSSIPKPCEKEHDHGREHAQKTRPRLVMTPAVTMDDIDNPTTREIICNDMYTSAARRASPEFVVSSIKAPFPGLPAAANPIYLPKFKDYYVSPEWRMDSVSWDNKQLRGYCDPTKEFWIRYPLSKCRACDENATVHAHRKRMRQMRSGRQT